MKYNRNDKKNILTTGLMEESNIFEEVTEQSPAEVETTGPETKNGIITGAMYVNVRREPCLDDDNVLEILREGDKVKFVDMKIDGFYKVTTSTHSVAYISASFVKEE